MLKQIPARIARIIHDLKTDRSFIRFCLVGGSGFILNLLIFYFLHTTLGAKGIYASLGSAVVAMTSNFVLNDSFTWPGQKRGTVYTRYIQFVMVSSVGIGINLLVFYLLYNWARMPGLLSNAIGIGIATGWNYIVNRYWTFRKQRTKMAIRT